MHFILRAKIQNNLVDSKYNRRKSRKVGKFSRISSSRNIVGNNFVLPLIDEFQLRGIDASAVYGGKAISFAHPVRYDMADNRLATIG